MGVTVRVLDSLASECVRINISLYPDFIVLFHFSQSNLIYIYWSWNFLNKYIQFYKLDFKLLKINYLSKYKLYVIDLTFFSFLKVHGFYLILNFQKKSI